MKRAAVILVVMLVAGPASLCGQNFFGLRGGVGAGTSRPYPYRKMNMVYGLAGGGVMWKYYGEHPSLGRVERILSGIGAEALYLQQGYGYPVMDGGRETDSVYMRRINSLMIPFMWQPHIYLAKERLLLFLNAGVTLSYNLNSKEGQFHKDKKAVPDKPYPMISVRDNRMGYGLCAGFGTALNLGRLEIFVEGRYFFGYSDVLKNYNKYADNPLRSPLDNLNLNVGFYYRIGKAAKPSADGGGIMELPPGALERLFEAPPLDREEIRGEENDAAAGSAAMSEDSGGESPPFEEQ